MWAGSIWISSPNRGRRWRNWNTRRALRVFGRHSPSSIWIRRTISAETLMPSSSSNFSAASVAPKPGYFLCKSASILPRAALYADATPARADAKPVRRRPRCARRAQGVELTHANAQTLCALPLVHPAPPGARGILAPAPWHSSSVFRRTSRPRPEPRSKGDSLMLDGGHSYVGLTRFAVVSPLRSSVEARASCRQFAG